MQALGWAVRPWIWAGGVTRRRVDTVVVSGWGTHSFRPCCGVYVGAALAEVRHQVSRDLRRLHRLQLRLRRGQGHGVRGAGAWCMGVLTSNPLLVHSCHPGSGEGKSTVSAALAEGLLANAEEGGEGQGGAAGAGAGSPVMVTAHHFVRADDARRLDVIATMKTLAFQLGSRCVDAQVHNAGRPGPPPGMWSLIPLQTFANTPPCVPQAAHGSGAAAAPGRRPRDHVPLALHHIRMAYSPHSPAAAPVLAPGFPPSASGCCAWTLAAWPPWPTPARPSTCCWGSR